jgi:hypothetical protein
VEITPYKENDKIVSVYKIPKVPRNTTLNMFMERGLRAVGPQRFFLYDAFKYNCQDFLAVLLSSSGVYTKDVAAFNKQDAEALFNGLPDYVRSAVRGVTDLGAIANIAVEGGGGGKRPNKVIRTPARKKARIDSEAESSSSSSDESSSDDDYEPSDSDSDSSYGDDVGVDYVSEEEEEEVEGGGVFGSKHQEPAAPDMKKVRQKAYDILYELFFRNFINNDMGELVDAEVDGIEERLQQMGLTDTEINELSVAAREDADWHYRHMGQKKDRVRGGSNKWVQSVLSYMKGVR